MPTRTLVHSHARTHGHMYIHIYPYVCVSSTGLRASRFCIIWHVVVHVIIQIDLEIRARVECTSSSPSFSLSLFLSPSLAPSSTPRPSSFLDHLDLPADARNLARIKYYAWLHVLYYIHLGVARFFFERANRLTKKSFKNASNAYWLSNAHFHNSVRYQTLFQGFFWSVIFSPVFLTFIDSERYRYV